MSIETPKNVYSSLYMENVEEDSFDGEHLQISESDTFNRIQNKKKKKIKLELKWCKCKDALSWRLFGGKEWNKEFILFCLLQ